MLEIIDIATKKIPSNFVVTIGPYMPMQTTCEEVFEVKYHWRSGNLHTSSVDIGIAMDSGEIRTFDLEVFDKCIITKPRQELLALPYQIGWPVCRTDNWPPGGYREDPAEFITEVCKDQFCVMFVGHHPIAYEVRCGNLRFGVTAEGGLCCIRVVDLTRSQVFPFIERCCRMIFTQGERAR